jgi:hypothetical protein
MATDGYSEATEDIVELMAVDVFKISMLYFPYVWLSMPK